MFFFLSSFTEHVFFPLLCFYTQNKTTANIQKIQITSLKQANMCVSEGWCMYNLLMMMVS